MNRLLLSASLAILCGMLAAAVDVAPVFAASPSVVVSYTDALRFFNSTTPISVTGAALGAGTWWVRVTAELDASGSALVTGETECDLRNGLTESDQARWQLDYGHPTGGAVVSIVLTGVITSGIPWNPTLHCATKAVTSVQLSNIRIDAISGAQSGSITPRLLSATADSASIPGDGAFHSVLGLSLPAGKWSVLGKTELGNSSSSITTAVTCRLKPSKSDLDQTSQSLGRHLQTGAEGEVAVEVAHNFASSAHVGLECRTSNAASATADHIRLVAIKAGKLTRAPIGGSSTSTGSGSPLVVSAFRTGSKSIPSAAIGSVGSLNLPAGKWYVSAKAWIHGADIRIECQLTGGTTLDDTFLRGGSGGSTGVYLHNGMDVSIATVADLRCKADTSGASLTYLRITAIKASAISLVFLP